MSEALIKECEALSRMPYHEGGDRFNPLFRDVATRLRELSDEVVELRRTIRVLENPELMERLDATRAALSPAPAANADLKERGQE